MGKGGAPANPMLVDGPCVFVVSIPTSSLAGRRRGRRGRLARRREWWRPSLDRNLPGRAIGGVECLPDYQGCPGPRRRLIPIGPILVGRRIGQRPRVRNEVEQISSCPRGLRHIRIDRGDDRTLLPV